MAKKQPKTKTIRNPKARFDYELGDSLVAGISLTGVETKSLRLGHGQLRGAYVIERGSEIWLVNATITGFSGAQIAESDQTRDRKLLLKQREIKALIERKKSGMSIVPLEFLTSGRYIKLKVALGRGKKKYDKRETIKKREQERSARST